MRFRPRMWSLISLLLFAAAFWVWIYAEKVSASRRAHAAPPASAQPAGPAKAKVADAPHSGQSKSYRVSNTRLTEKELLRGNHAIILRNALIDTDRPLKLNIPAHLRAKGAPGSYIVQSQRPLDQRFYDRLQWDGARYVSYIPNNAALVEATPEQALAMASDASFQAVVPYEPYYKLATPLLSEAIADQQPEPVALNVTTPPGQRDAGLKAMLALGAQLMGEDNGPFGTTLTVMAPPDKLVAIAQLPQAEEIEPYAPRRALNDLTRVALGIATNSLYATPNYLHLTGLNVTLNMNDTGVDSTHPDFGGNGGLRLEGAASALSDYSGHGTHVAGIIMGNGSKSTNVTTIVPGENTTGIGFQGKATNATLFVQSLGLVVGVAVADSFLTGGSLVSDASLQTNASVQLGPTNLISNNSWGYNGPASYDMHAASFDQATRDAQPLVPGEQPLLFVVAAGGSGNGNNDGSGAIEGSILSPATAKNVITVGAMDSARYITNEITFDDQSTNAVFQPWTDNNDLVAWFSSCGNVSAGTEGLFGRFKPDVVAPGVFTISCRATNYVDPTNAVEITTYPFPNQQVLPGRTVTYPLSLPGDTEALVAVVTPNAQSPAPFPNLEILGDTFTPPTTVLSATNYSVLSNLTAGTWYFGVTTPAGQIQPVAYDLTFYLVETNDLGVATTNASGYFTVISNLNSVLKPYYVYQTGTSMSAGAVSGMLALMQEFLQSRMDVTNPSPALLKALLINGSRSAEEQYDFNPQAEAANEQGWGLPNLPNSLPGSLTNGKPSLLFVNQSTANALATGQSQTYTVNGDTNAVNYPIRVTLVWTDPPGDPAAGIALVNNLDLVVTDTSGSNIWLGNDFFSGDIFTEANTGNLPDAINNVQNVYINSTNTPFQFPLYVTVLGTRVNVNAATTATNLIAQDFALVISSDDTALTTGLTATSNAPTYGSPANLQDFAKASMTNGGGTLLLSPPLLAFVQSNYALVTVASNAVPLLHQRVGANEPNLYANGSLYAKSSLDTNGNLFQWHFFVFGQDQFTNNDQTNLAFTTFLPPDLATQISPRTNGADLDMYVSTDPNLTNLDPNVIASSVLNGWASLSRGGTETVIFTNAAITTYYIGIKSEDQQGGDFGFYAVAQEEPFSTVNPNGSVTAGGTGVPVTIPDSGLGPPGLVFAFLIDPENPQMTLQKVTASVGIEHGNPSDLYGTLQHNQIQTVLNSYSGPPGGFTNIYNDLDDNTGGIGSDGPGSLKNYISTAGQGMWMLTEADNALLQAGQVNSFSVTGFPQPLGLGFTITIGALQWFDDYVVVPTDATNMIISVSYASGSGPVGIFITNTDNVGFNDYGVEPISPPGGFLSYGITNNPPLAGGTWYYGIYNYNANSSVTLNVQITFELRLVPNLVQTYTNSTLTPLTTDGTTNSSQICITSGQQLLDLSVGVRLNDPNLDDLVLQLTSPQGTSVLLFENRGGLLATNLGLTVTNSTSTNYVYTTFTEDTNMAAEPIKFAPPPYATNSVTALTNLYFTSFEDAASGAYTNGRSVDGWLVETNQVSVVTDPAVARAGTNYLALASGRLSQTFATMPGASYELRYYARSPGLISWWPAEGNANDLVGANNGSLINGATYAGGEVGRAFAFNGANQYIVIPDSASLRPAGLTVEGWINFQGFLSNLRVVASKAYGLGTLDSWAVWQDDNVGQIIGAIVSAGGVQQPFLRYNWTPAVGTWHHVAYTFAAGASYQALYVDGAMVAGGACSGPIAYDNHPMQIAADIENGSPAYFFDGEIDETSIYNRALTAAEIHAIYAAGSSGKYSTNSLYPNFQVAIDGISTNTVIITNFAATNWQSCTNSFIATGSQTTIELAGNPLGVLLDDVELVQLPYTNYDNYFLPEEPLAPFIGENPQGCWTLSVWDTRQDTALPANGALLSWTLQMTTSSTNVNLIVLTNGIPYRTTNLPPNSIVYFGVDVPVTANYATNFLFKAAGSMNLLFNQNALPTGGLPGDVTLVTLPNPGESGSKTLTTQGAPPPLLPGQRYFLGVQNTGSGAEAFSLQVTFDVSSNASIVPLNSGIPVNGSLSTNGPAFYSFTIPTDAVMATFQLLSPANGQADLYAREGLPVPGPLSFDYQSMNGGTSDQFIVITTNSVPVPLQAAGANGILPVKPATWYLSVYNFGGAPKVGYTILATYVTTNGMKIVSLNNYANYTYTNGLARQGFPTNLLYSFTVTNAKPEAVQFTVTNISANGNLQLLAGDGAFPTPNDFYAGSFNLGPANQFVSIVTNSALTSLSNIWYLAVPNTSTNTVAYSVSAAVVTSGVVTGTPLFIGASIASPANGFTMYWNAVPGQSYQIQVSTDLATWVLATNVTAQSTVGAYTDAVPVISQQSRFFRIVTP